MKKYKLLLLLLSSVLLAGLLPVRGHAADAPALTSVSAVLVDAGAGDVLFEKDGSRTMDTGAVNALMTALLVGEAVQNQQVALDAAVTAPGDVLYDLQAEGAATLEPAIQPGETLTVDELLHAILLRTAGDACNALASFMAGSISAFVQNMNTRAEELGCTSTSFQDVNGQLSGQRTTARDTAIIARAAASVPALVNICDDDAFTISATNLAGERTLTNSNQLMVPESEFYYGEAYGLKAGYSALDGYSVIAAATSSDIDAIAVVLGNADGSARFQDAVTLLDWVFDNYSYRTVLSETESIDNVPVHLGTTDSIAVRPDDSVRLLMPKDRDLGDVQYTITYYHEQENRDLVAPIDYGTSLGEVAVYLDGQALGSAHLVATSASDMSRLEYLRTQFEDLVHSDAVRKLGRVLLIMLIIYLLLVFIYCFQRVRHLVSLRQARRARARSLAQQEVAWLDIPEDTDRNAPIDFFQPGDDYADDDGGYDDEPPGRRIARPAHEAAPMESDGYNDPYDDQYESQYDDQYGNTYDDN